MPTVRLPDLSIPAFHIVLVRPEIPQNTGSIARLAAATRTRLHLVGPLGFSLDPLVQKAILDSLTAETRERLVEQAVKNLITPERDNYGRTPEPPIQAMFRTALYSCAEQAVQQVADRAEQD